MTVHDFFFYASREYGRHAAIEPVINNFALNYAINNALPDIHSFVSGTKPRYEEDMAKIKLYATPAHPYVTAVANIAYSVIPWERTNPIWISYNAVDSTLLFSMEHKKRKVVVPMFGSYQRYPPLNSFEFFLFGGKGPSVIRIGKKLIPVRLSYYKCYSIKIKNGIVSPSHPVNFIEIKDKYEFLHGKILMIPPAPVVIHPKLRGKYISCKFKDEQGKEKQAELTIPNEKIYKKVDLGDFEN